jgi:hypothetical protein
MSDTDIASVESAYAGAPVPVAAPVAPTPAAPDAPRTAASARPAFLPEKFWDAAAGRVRLEDMARSYRALEQKLGRSAETRRPRDPGTSPHATDMPPPRDAGPDSAPPGAASVADDDGARPRRDASGDADASALDTGVPAAPEGYTARVSHPWLARDAEIDGLLHAAGFTQAQAQLVYDLAAERVIPAIEAMAREHERRLAQARLEAHFGGPERFEALARQVRAWGERHLPRHLFETLSETPDGIVALHHMMRAGEPRFLAGDKPAAGPTQAELEALVRDPRYWRDHEPTLVKRVEEGFRRLYPGA